MNTLLYKENLISVTCHFLKKNILLVYLSAIGVYPLSMFTLRCNFTTCNFEFWAELFHRINLSSYFQASYFSGIYPDFWNSKSATLDIFKFFKYHFNVFKGKLCSFPFSGIKKARWWQVYTCEFLLKPRKKFFESSFFH